MAVPALQRRYGAENVIPVIFHYDPPFLFPGFTGDAWHSSASRSDTSATPNGSWLFVAVDGQYPRSPLSSSEFVSPGRRVGVLREYDELQPIIERRLQEPPDASIEATARFNGNIVEVEVRAAKTRKNRGEPRIHIVMTEDSIRQPGQDGVRFQTNVVRYIAGDSASGFGFSIPAGATSRTEKHRIDLVAVAKMLEERNSPAHEKDISGHWDGYRWSYVPPATAYTFNRKRLRIVAFVQDATTGEIWDVVSAPISGKTTP